MRKRPMQNNNNSNYGHKRRHPSQGRHNNGNHQPRRNYHAAREKYLAQARDALSAGDRVMAEYFHQHAEHCFRMMAEENASRPPRQQNTQQSDNQQSSQGDEVDSSGVEDTGSDDAGTPHASQLPAFITSSYSGAKKEQPADVTPQDWEERDA